MNTKYETIKQLLPLTEKNIEKWEGKVKETPNYGKEMLIIRDVLNKFPLHNDINIIAMKIAVIDVTNSTHLHQYKKVLSLYDLAEVILNIPNIDNRLKNGDPDLVNIIAKNIGAKNLFSFASKYCTYHNVEIYKKDDYSIYDSVLKDYLPCYVNQYDLPKITPNEIDKKWRQEYDYKSYNDCIGNLLEKANINVPFKRRKFDHFIWYVNKKSTNTSSVLF